MGMELTHTFTVPATVEQTWALLTDLEQVGGCFPGATVTETDGDTFAGTVKVKLGPIQMQYAGTGSFLERDDTAHKAVIEGKGKDRRGNGTASATATMSLSQDGDGTTVEVLTDLVVTGKPAQFGRGVMQDVSDKLLTRFVDCLESTLGSDKGQAAGPDHAEAAGPDHADAAGEAPSQSPKVEYSVLADPTPAAGTAHVGAVAPADDAIDLGDLVGPVLLQRYGTALAAGVIGLVIGIAIGRALER